MAFKVVHTDEGQAGRVCRAFRESKAYDERAHKPWSLRGRDRGEVCPRQTRSGERLVRDGHDRLHVLARGNLGDDATEARMEVYLAGHHAGQDVAPAVDDGNGRLVAGTFDGKDKGGDGRLVRGGACSAGGIRVGVLGKGRVGGICLIPCRPGSLAGRRRRIRTVFTGLRVRAEAHPVCREHLGRTRVEACADTLVFLGIR